MCEGEEYVWTTKGILECDPKGLDDMPQGRPCAEQCCRKNGLTHLWRIMVEGLLGRWEHNAPRSSTGGGGTGSSMGEESLEERRVCQMPVVNQCCSPSDLRKERSPFSPSQPTKLTLNANFVPGSALGSLPHFSFFSRWGKRGDWQAPTTQHFKVLSSLPHLHSRKGKEQPFLYIYLKIIKSTIIVL